MRTAFILFLFYTSVTFGQISAIEATESLKKQGFAEKKKMQTKFTTNKIVIDGSLNEAIWSETETATNFVSFEPDNGNPIPENKKTEVKIVYDNDGIYIGATLYDNEPSKILKEFSKRDDFGTTDFFGVFINGYNDGQQDFRFFVSTSNGQADCQASDNQGEDFSWDAIWESKTKITDIGWIVEMKIPYAALRFSTEKKQTWGINFMREVRRDRQKYTWNFIDRKFGTFIQQAGILEGIENIKTPTRLFLFPYSSYYLNADKENKTKGTIKGGLDIKYGINDAFTLDAVLIPDFGQTAVDQKILNLGPFEQQFNENRPFFTEGTDLFNKGNLFYSRRIGGRPTINPDLTSDEETIDLPSSVGLLNALKISGRTKKGLGIGVLNAITEKTFVTIQNKNTGATRSEIVEPLTNFNILVFDQRFRKNSSISFINTNVTRNAGYRDGNVSALVWDLNTKANTYNLQGSYKLSTINENLKYTNGSNAYLELNETSGKYRYGAGANIMTKDYDNNDLGINFQTNYYSAYANASYRILNPNKYFNRFNLSINFFNQFQIETGKPQASEANINLNIGSKNNNAYGMFIFSNPIQTYDYYEARVDGRVFLDPSRIGFGGYYSSNYNKKFAYDIDANLIWANQTARNGFEMSLSPRYRFNDRLSLVYRASFKRILNTKGYTTQIDTDKEENTPKDIIIGNRDIVTFSNNLTGKYSISSQMNFNLALIHYWSYSENKNFLLLEQSGDLTDYLALVPNQNKDFSNWNVDLSYSWWFAPGSQLSVLYRNSASNFSEEINKDYKDNFTNLLRNDVLSHTFSISLKYFIDYNQAKNWF
jgi:Domain of unknown function (DUF5916)/Carbohydrate family 9 binding domain-like